MQRAVAGVGDREQQQGDTMTIADSPKPRRMNRPRWLDARVVGGVLLLVASVIIGARVIGASSHTSPVWAAARDLAAGTVLQAGDLVAVDVNLGESTSGYLGAGSVPAGGVLSRPVGSGELLPAAAVGSVGDGRIVAVGVTPDRMPPDVRHGSVIDLYLTTGGSGLTGNDAQTRLLLAGVTVQSVASPASGGLSGATSSRYQVALLLPPADADAVVRALPTGEPMVVLQTDRGGSLGAGSAAGPGVDGAGAVGADPADAGGTAVHGKDTAAGGTGIVAGTGNATGAPDPPTRNTVSAGSTRRSGHGG
jgi:hypothetical protein